MNHRITRRNFLRDSVVASSMAGLTVRSIEEQTLLAALSENEGNPPISPPETSSESDLPRGKIGNLQISRLILGGNLIGGWAHARDLVYVSRLFKAYNTESKVFETMHTAEEHGINAILVNPSYLEVVKKYNEQEGGNLQVISEIHVSPKETKEQAIREEVRRLIGLGADTIYIQGGVGDRLLRAGRIDLFAKTVKAVKDAGLPAGVGSHTLEVTKACEEQDVGADFYMKTFHPLNYWSASHPEDRKHWFEKNHHDNIWCTDPEETRQFMQTVKKPWLAFKILAAGSIYPKRGFLHAYQNGADFAVVGMFDFQIAEDTKIAKMALRHKSVVKRERPWCA